MCANVCVCVCVCVCVRVVVYVCVHAYDRKRCDGNFLVTLPRTSFIDMDCYEFAHKVVVSVYIIVTYEMKGRSPGYMFWFWTAVSESLTIVFRMIAVVDTDAEVRVSV